MKNVNIISEYSDFEVLTLYGWKKSNEIDLQTLLGTYTKLTGRIVWQKALAITYENYEGDMFHIKNQHTDLLVPANHYLWLKYNKSGQWQARQIGNIKIGRGRVHFVVSGKLQLPDFDIKDDELRISAWFLTDGGFKSNKRGHQKYVNFYQRKSKVHMITEILDRLGWNYSLKERFRNIVKIMGKTLVGHESEVKINLLTPFHRTMAKLVPLKYILPEWVYKLSDRQFDIFLDSYIDGDGSRHKSAPKTSLMIYGVEEIIDQMQIAAFLHGYRTSISEYRPGAFRLNLTKNSTTCISIFQDSTERLYFQGKILKIKTHNETLVVRRKGKISVIVSK